MAKKEIYTAYAELMEAKREIEEQIEALKGDVIAKMKKESLLEVDHEKGKFYFRTTRKWEYPEVVKDLESKMKLEKAKAEEKGTAKLLSETESLVFTKAK
jgi:regulator of replication initiation timing